MRAAALAVVAVILAAGGAAVAEPKPACGLGAPQACPDANALAWSPGFQRALRRFVGPAKGRFNGQLRAADAAIDDLGGPPDEAVRLANGGWLFSACQAHDCPNKGALLLDATGRIRGVGLVNYACAPRGGCADQPRLTLFLRDTADVAATATLTDWARATLAKDNAAYPSLPQMTLSGVEVRRAAGG